MKDFAAAMFQPHVGGEFVFLRPADAAGNRAPVKLDLLQVREGKSQPVGFRCPFALVFGLRGEAPLDYYEMHQLAEAGYEEADLLLSRVAMPELDRHDGTIFYEAVFG